MVLPNIQEEQFWDRYTGLESPSSGSDLSPRERVEEAFEWKIIASKKTGEVYDEGVHVGDIVHLHERLPWLAGGIHRQRSVRRWNLAGIDRALTDAWEPPLIRLNLNKLGMIWETVR